MAAPAKPAAPVAQWIEQPSPKGQVARSIRVRGAKSFNKSCRTPGKPKRLPSRIGYRAATAYDVHNLRRETHSASIWVLDGGAMWRSELGRARMLRGSHSVEREDVRPPDSRRDRQRRPA